MFGLFFLAIPVLFLIVAAVFFYFPEKKPWPYPHRSIILRKLPILIGLSLAMTALIMILGGSVNDHMFGGLVLMFFFMCAVGGSIFASVWLNYIFVRKYREGEFSPIWIFRSLVDGISILLMSFLWIGMLRVIEEKFF